MLANGGLLTEFLTETNPGKHNFVLDVTDNNNVLTHKTVKLIVKAAE